MFPAYSCVIVLVTIPAGKVDAVKENSKPMHDEGYSEEEDVESEPSTSHFNQ